MSTNESVLNVGKRGKCKESLFIAEELDETICKGPFQLIQLCDGG